MISRAQIAKREIPVERRVIPQRDHVTFDLPLPPSLNHAFVNVPGKGRVRSNKYNAWRTEAGWALRAQRVSPVAGPVCVKIELQDGVRGDADNRIKPILDLCVSHRLIEDDHGGIVRKVSVEWGDVEGARITIRSVT